MFFLMFVKDLFEKGQKIFALLKIFLQICELIKYTLEPQRL